MSHSCGECTLCCKLLGVEELKKPAGVRCQHVKMGKGCMIYKDRPPSCAEFACLWLARDELPEELRPDKVHMVMATGEDPTDMLVWVERLYPDAWLKEPMHGLLKALAESGMTVIIGIEGRRDKIILERSRDGIVTVEKVEFSKPDELGRQYRIKNVLLR